VASSTISSAVTIRFEPLLLMANYSKNRKAEFSQELYCNCSRRRLELGEVRRCRIGSKKTREARKRDRREV